MIQNRRVRCSCHSCACAQTPEHNKQEHELTELEQKMAAMASLHASHVTRTSDAERERDATMQQMKIQSDTYHARIA